MATEPYKPTRLPIDKSELLAVLSPKHGGLIEAEVPFDIWELIGHDTEGVNDLAEGRILGDLAVLADISYEVSGVRSGRGANDILVRVRAEVVEY